MVWFTVKGAVMGPMQESPKREKACTDLSGTWMRIQSVSSISANSQNPRDEQLYSVTSHVVLPEVRECVIAIV